jgi:hypothetical protein
MKAPGAFALEGLDSAGVQPSQLRVSVETAYYLTERFARGALRWGSARRPMPTLCARRSPAERPRRGGHLQPR